MFKNFKRLVEALSGEFGAKILEQAKIADLLPYALRLISWELCKNMERLKYEDNNILTYCFDVLYVFLVLDESSFNYMYGFEWDKNEMNFDKLIITGIKNSRLKTLVG